MSNHSAIAPEKIRKNVKEAGSTLVSFNAAVFKDEAGVVRGHRSELLAKAIIARSVSIKILVDFTIDEIGAESLSAKRRINLNRSTLLSSITFTTRQDLRRRAGRHASKR